MQVQQIQNQNFKGFNISKTGNKLMERLCTASRYRRFSQMEIGQINNPYEIHLTVGNRKNFIGEIINLNGEVLYKAEENKINGILNLSPIKFFAKLCEKADEILAKSKQSV